MPSLYAPRSQRLITTLRNGRPFDGYIAPGMPLDLADPSEAYALRDSFPNLAEAAYGSPVNLVPNPSLENGTNGAAVPGNVSSNLGQNFILNPRAALNTANTSAYGTNTVTRSSEQFMGSDGFSYKLTYNNDTRLIGLTNDAGAAANASQYIVGQCWVWIPSDYNGGNITINDQGTLTGTTIVTTSPNMTLRNTWQPICVIRQNDADSADAWALFLSATSGVPTAGRFIYATRFMTWVVPSSPLANIPLPYCDGDTPGWFWSSTPHASMSSAMSVGQMYRYTTAWARHGALGADYNPTRFDSPGIAVRSPLGVGTFAPATPGSTYGGRVSVKLEEFDCPLADVDPSIPNQRTMRGTIYFYDAANVSTGNAMGTLAATTPGVYDLAVVGVAPANTNKASVGVFFDAVGAYRVKSYVDAFACYLLPGGSTEANVP